MKRIILSAGLNADLTNFCDLEEQVTTKQDEYNDEKSTKGYNYIIREREFIRMNEDVYKVGKCEDMSKRFKQYPKGSELVKYAAVKDRHMSESLMIDDFKKHFLKAADMLTGLRKSAAHSASGLNDTKIQFGVGKTILGFRSRFLCRFLGLRHDFRVWRHDFRV